MNKPRQHTVTISVQKHKEYQFYPDTHQIKKYITYLIELTCSLPTEVAICFCGTEQMIQMNHTFRQKKKPTDVLSFVPSASFMQDNSFLGDILVCIPVCVAQAKRAKHTLSDELLKMLIHSVVHLKGFDHERNAAAERVMSKMERALKLEILKKFGTPHFEKEIKK